MLRPSEPLKNGNEKGKLKLLQKVRTLRFFMKRYLVLENIRSLHNVGAIFRTADGAGWDKIFLTGYTGCPPDRRIEKVSLGAEQFVAWEHVSDPNECVQKLKEAGFEILALEQTKDSIEINAFKPNKNLALILGNEVDGVSSELLERCNQHVQIPMRGQKASLNVSVAAGIAMYGLKP